MGGNKKRRRDEDEPRPEGEEWVEQGGQLMWAAGFTPGGAPYGLTVEDFRDANEQCSRKRGWAHAKAALRSAVGALLDPAAEADLRRELVVLSVSTRLAFLIRFSYFK